MSDEIGIVGKKGELYPPKNIRVALNLKPHDKVRYIMTPNGNLLIKKITSIEDILKKKPIAKITFEEAEKISEQNQNEEERHFENSTS